MTNRNRHHRRQRAGSVYVAVLGVAMIVAVIAIGAITVQRVVRKMAQQSLDMAQARDYAIAAIEIGQLRVKSDSQWRTTFPNGVWETAQVIGTGTYTLEGTDPADGDLTDDPMDPIRLVGIGRNSSARQKVATTFQPTVFGMTCLEVAAIGASVSLDDANVDCDQIICSNDGMSATSAAVQSDVEAVGAIWGWSYLGSSTSGVPARTMPDGSVFDYYTANGTQIAFSSLVDKKKRTRALTNVVLSPNANPYGADHVNAMGIYVIDCGGDNLVIRDCRILGTLVVLNAGSKSRVERAVNWSAAIANFPALLVQGPFELRHERAIVLAEANAGGVNFNPPGTPYEGSEDTDTTDQYPTEINGLVYVSENVKWKKTANVTGAVVCGAFLQLSGDLLISYRSTYLNDPPPGFRTTILIPIAGSWQQIVDP